MWRDLFNRATFPKHALTIVCILLAFCDEGNAMPPEVRRLQLVAGFGLDKLAGAVFKEFLSHSLFDFFGGWHFASSEFHRLAIGLEKIHDSFFPVFGNFPQLILCIMPTSLQTACPFQITEPAPFHPISVPRQGGKHL
ncbi:MAG: hypothetical protein K1Y36_12800 [Blastocatellia bacterium]|nr:hypothetical protein [Blastocatellia bacterium]